MGARRCALPLPGLGYQGILLSQEEESVLGAATVSMCRATNVKVNAAQQ